MSLLRYFLCLCVCGFSLRAIQLIYKLRERRRRTSTSFTLKYRSRVREKIPRSFTACKCVQWFLVMLRPWFDWIKGRIKEATRRRRNLKPVALLVTRLSRLSFCTFRGSFCVLLFSLFLTRLNTTSCTYNLPLSAKQRKSNTSTSMRRILQFAAFNFSSDATLERDTVMQPMDGIILAAVVLRENSTWPG